MNNILERLTKPISYICDITLRNLGILNADWFNLCSNGHVAQNLIVISVVS